MEIESIFWLSFVQLICGNLTVVIWCRCNWSICIVKV